MNIDHPQLDRAITIREAYRALDRFLAAHLERGETSTVDLVSYACLCADGSPGDPAAIRDYLDALAEVERTAAPERPHEVEIDDDPRPR